MSAVQIRIEASGVNRADLLQLSGDYRPPAGESDVPGLELAGTVIEVVDGGGDGDDGGFDDGGGGGGGFAVGDRVCALVGSGAHAASCVVPARMCLPVPAGMPATAAAALPEALATAWWNLVRLAQVRPGETVLVHGANSGVGHLVVQSARVLGAHVIAGVRGTRWDGDLAVLGATPVDTTAADAAARVLAIAPDGVDVAVDLVGASTAAITTAVLGRGGRWLAIGLLGGADVALSLRDVIRGRWHLTGSSIRSLGGEEKAAAIAGVRADLWPAVEDGRIAARIHRVLPRRRREDAWALMAGGGYLGKIILTGDDDE